MTHTDAAPVAATCAAAWTRYWSRGALHSCAGSYADDYGGSIEAFWRRVFADVRDGQRVLDVATGNAALPHLLLRCRPETAFRCDAIDTANVDPPWLGTLSAPVRSRFAVHAGVAAERLPFGDLNFDLVVSQYGIEYAERDCAAAEVRRVLGPGGRIALVVHHADSIPVALAADEIAHIDWLVEPEGLLDLARRLLAPMARAATEEGRRALRIDALAHADRAAFNALQRAADQRIAEARCPDVLHESRDALAQLLATARRQGLDTALRGWNALHQHLVDARQRLARLRECALDIAGAQALAAALRPDAAADSRVEPLHDDNRIMGWAVEVAAR